MEWRPFGSLRADSLIGARHVHCNFLLPGGNPSVAYSRGGIAMTHTLVTRLLVIASLVLPITAFATCPPSCPIPGGGNPSFDPSVDCLAEFASTGMHLNYKLVDPLRPR